MTRDECQRHIVAAIRAQYDRGQDSVADSFSLTDALFAEVQAVERTAYRAGMAEAAQLVMLDDDEIEEGESPSYVEGRQDGNEDAVKAINARLFEMSQEERKP